MASIQTAPIKASVQDIIFLNDEDEIASDLHDGISIIANSNETFLEQGERLSHGGEFINLDMGDSDFDEIEFPAEASLDGGYVLATGSDRKSAFKMISHRDIKLSHGEEAVRSKPVSAYQTKQSMPQSQPRSNIFGHFIPTISIPDTAEIRSRFDNIRLPLRSNVFNRSTLSQSLPGYSSGVSTIRIRENVPSNFYIGDSVELHDNTFLRITKVRCSSQQETMVTGRPLILQNDYAYMVPKCRGEVLWKVDVLVEEGGYRREVKETTVGASSVRRHRQIIFTNASLQKVSRSAQSQVQRQGRSTLYCRRKLVQAEFDRKSFIERAIENLTSDEADPGYSISEEILRTEWRGTTIVGGSCAQASRTQAIVDVDVEWHSDSNLTSQNFVFQRYTIGDAFCGAGGVSSGAQQAGLKVKWGFDIDQYAMATYRANFESNGTIGLLTDVSRFLNFASKSFMVDILHLSPPCQPYSPAHTTSQNIERDEQNQAVLFSTWQMVDRLKPRVVTMEETEGLYNRHPQYFYSLIHTFMAHGYSIRWRIINTYHYGVPQSRRRAVLFAAGPGERLPLFPEPTHGGQESDLICYQTIVDALSDIPRHATHHDTKARFKNGPKAPYDPRKPAFTLTCGGGENNYHPSGLRNYTVREMAALQTFPHHHSFADNSNTAARKQIGNAVPPKLAKELFKAVIKSLKASDQEEVLRHRSACLPRSQTTLPSSSSDSSFHSAVQSLEPGNSHETAMLLD